MEFVKLWHFVGRKSCPLRIQTWRVFIVVFFVWKQCRRAQRCSKISRYFKQWRNSSEFEWIESIGVTCLSECIEKIGMNWMNWMNRSELNNGVTWINWNELNELNKSEWIWVNWSEWSKEQMIQVANFSKSSRSTYVNQRLQAIAMSWLCVEATHHQRHILRLRDAWPACFSREGLNRNFRFDCFSGWVTFSFLLISWLDRYWERGFTTDETHVIVDCKGLQSVWPGIIWHCCGAGVPNSDSRSRRCSTVEASVLPFLSWLLVEIRRCVANPYWWVNLGGVAESRWFSMIHIRSY